MADYQALSNIASAIQSFATAASLLVGGLWVYRRYIREAEDFPHIESDADIVFIGRQDGYWIVELVGILENKGKVRHRINSFEFDVHALYSGDPAEPRDKLGGQVEFPRAVLNGSFLPSGAKSFVIDPGIRAKYSFLGRIPERATMIVLHCWFKYLDQPGFQHTAEKSLQVPSVDADLRPED